MIVQRLLISLVKGYRLLLSPWLGSACRFEPTCSVYSLQALEQHGAAAGSYLTLKRLVRCNPWCEGGHDPVPDNFSLFSRLHPGACRTWSVESENWPQRGQFLPDLQAHSAAMGQKYGEKWTAVDDLQPTISKSDRLLAQASQVSSQHSSQKKSS